MALVISRPPICSIELPLTEPSAPYGALDFFSDFLPAQVYSSEVGAGDERVPEHECFEREQDTES